MGEKTIIEQVVATLSSGGIEEIIVVTGGARQQIETLVSGKNVRLVFNPDFENGEMLISMQTGLNSLGSESEAALMVLGDQPQMRPETIASILEVYNRERASLIIPSFQMRRGHPWLIGRELWNNILSLNVPETLRDFLNRFEDKITYLEVDSASILKDVDTPEEYLNERPDSRLS